MESSIETEAAAREWLERVIKWHTGAGLKVVAQGDELPPVDLFTPLAPTERLHPYFIHLSNEPSFLPARKIISEMMPHFTDVDGNFVEQFQTTGFDARLWELYLFAYVNEEELFLDRAHAAPDFIVTKYGKTVAIEAMIVGRRSHNPPKYFKVDPGPKIPDDVESAQQDLFPIQFGSPLYSKLKKKYWDLPHVHNRPLVFAIADFHDDQSMLWTSAALMNYLYGVRHEFEYSNTGGLVISTIKIETHKLGAKEIPSGFFYQPAAEHVSAVLFSASGTISKFNRLGRQAGFKGPRTLMIRFGTCHDHNPNASIPKSFRYVVDETSNETWGEGLSMFHNPRASHPVPQRLFPSIAHHRFVDGQIVSRLPDFHPYGSFTLNMRAHEG